VVFVIKEVVVNQIVNSGFLGLGRIEQHPSPRFARILDTVAAWRIRRAERRQLRQLDDAILRDLGLGSGDVEREAAKPFWRA
jgi:uncharacterized protein YjiS (DUF1127 family)